MDEHLRQAVEALEKGAAEVRNLVQAGDVRRRLRRTVEEILDHLEDEEAAEPEDIVARLDRQARDIAEDLRRADRLMRRRTDQD